MTENVAIILEWETGIMEGYMHWIYLAPRQTSLHVSSAYFHATLEETKKGTWNLAWKGFEKDSPMGRGQIKYDRTTRDRPKNWRRIPLTILIWTGLILMVAVKSAGAVLEVPSARSWIQVVIDDRCLFPWHVNGSKIRAVCQHVSTVDVSGLCRPGSLRLRTAPPHRGPTCWQRMHRNPQRISWAWWYCSLEERNQG